MGYVRCAVDLRTGTVTIDRPPVENALWKQQTTQALSEGQIYQVVVERRRTTKGGFTDRARVSLRVTDSGTGDPVRTIPVQEFTGDHEGAAARAMTIKDGVARFWMEFWMLD